LIGYKDSAAKLLWILTGSNKLLDAAVHEAKVENRKVAFLILAWNWGNGRARAIGQAKAGQLT
jgi:hypothetical protein